jgi:glucose uptake protein GlcU
LIIRALGTSFRRNAKFKGLLAPLINDAQCSLTSLGTSLTFAAMELQKQSGTEPVRTGVQVVK